MRRLRCPYMAAKLGSATITSCPSVSRCCATHSLSVDASRRIRIRGPAPEHRRQALASGRDSSVDDRTALRDNTDLTFILVQVDGTILNGWSSPLRLKSAFQQCGAQAITSLRK